MFNSLKLEKNYINLLIGLLPEAYLAATVVTTCNPEQKKLRKVKKTVIGRKSKVSSQEKIFFLFVIVLTMLMSLEALFYCMLC